MGHSKNKNLFTATSKVTVSTFTDIAYDITKTLRKIFVLDYSLHNLLVPNLSFFFDYMRNFDILAKRHIFQ